MRTRTFVGSAALAAGMSLVTPALALVVPFTEGFAGNAANWRDNASALALSFNAAGGPDGSSYVSTPFSFVNNAEGDQVSLFRANGANVPTPGGAASDGAFFGSWITGGVSSTSFSFRHNATVPLHVFIRFASPGNFPGAAVQFTALAQPNAWTSFSVVVSPANLAIIYEGGPSNFGSVFGNVGRLQIGAIVPAGLAGGTSSITFDLDQVSLVPAPGAAALLGLAGAAAARRRRA